MKFSNKEIGALALLIQLCLLTATVGCRTASKWTLPAQSISYSDAEVFSKTWTNYNGRIMRLLSSVVRSSKEGGDFMIAKVGDKESNEAYFCEIYRATRISENGYHGVTNNVYSLLARTGDVSGHLLVGGLKMEDCTNKVIVSVDFRVNPRYAHSTSGLSSSGSVTANLVSYPLDGGVLYDLVFTKNYSLRQSYWAYAGKPQIQPE